MGDAWIGALAAVVVAIFSFLGNFLANRKQAALISYRVEQIEKNISRLEAKQDKHNNMIERVYKIEGRLTETEHEICDLKGART